CRQLNTLALRICLQEARGEKTAVLLQVAAGIVERLTLDEILHRVGSDQADVVTSGVSRPEGIAINQHLNVGSEDRILPGGHLAAAVQTVHGHVAFAVITPLPAAGELLHANSLFDRLAKPELR